MGASDILLGGNPAMDEHPIQQGVTILIGMLHAKETGINSGRLGLSLVCTFYCIDLLSIKNIICMLFSFFTWQHFDETAHNSLLKEMFTQVCAIHHEGLRVFGCSVLFFSFFLFFFSIIIIFFRSHVWTSLHFLLQIFSTPCYHPKSKPFIDHILSFSIEDNRIWFRNFQVNTLSWIILIFWYVNLF